MRFLHGSVVPGLVGVVLFLGSSPAMAQTISFGAQQVITTAADRASSVYANDLDGDGDADVLSASAFHVDSEISWYENQGGGVFGAQQVITTAVWSASIFRR